MNPPLPSSAILYAHCSTLHTLEGWSFQGCQESAEHLKQGEESCSCCLQPPIFGHFHSKVLWMAVCNGGMWSPSDHSRLQSKSWQIKDPLGMEIYHVNQRPKASQEFSLERLF
uniref:Uncharacterized protein n=1 Tax=Lygus hesperus TaxID=30085 RepID=A0A0K8SYS0_LYGHE